MKQKIFTAFALLLTLVLSANGQNQKDILKKAGIVMVKIYRTDYGKEYLAYELKLDTNGNTIDSTAFHSNGRLNGHVSKKFDNQSRMTENTVFSQISGNELVATQEIIVYDSKGRIIKYEIKYPITQVRGQSCTFEYIDNEFGLVLTKKEECNGIKSEIHYKYNKNRDLTKEIYPTYAVTYKPTYHKNGKLQSNINYQSKDQQEWIYDDSGTLIEYTQFGRDNWVYTYDENGDKIKITKNPLGSSIFSLYETELTYNNQRQVVTRLEKSGQSGDIDGYYIYEYSSTGLLISVKNFKTQDTESDPVEQTRFEYHL